VSSLNSRGEATVGIIIATAEFTSLRFLYVHMILNVALGCFPVSTATVHLLFLQRDHLDHLFDIMLHLLLCVLCCGQGDRRPSFADRTVVHRSHHSLSRWGACLGDLDVVRHARSTRTATLVRLLGLAGVFSGFVFLHRGCAR
jgi:hypothetical protein